MGAKRPGSDSGEGMTYRDAGVDIDAQDEALERIKGFLRQTRTPGVLADLGPNHTAARDIENGAGPGGDTGGCAWSDEPDGENEEDHGEGGTDFLGLGYATFATGFSLPSLCWLLSPIL